MSIEYYRVGSSRNPDGLFRIRRRTDGGVARLWAEYWDRFDGTWTESTIPFRYVEGEPGDYRVSATTARRVRALLSRGETPQRAATTRHGASGRVDDGGRRR